MTIDRRTLLAGSTTLALALPFAGPAAGRTGDAASSGLPMPAPRTGAPPPPVPPEDPNRLLLDRGWLFHDGDIVPPPVRGHGASYCNAKAGNARGAAAIDYDDSDWQAVDLPHDWAAAQPIVADANLSQGFRRRGIGWYRRALRIDAADRGRYLELQFGAIATNATIWVNGTVVAHNWSGYTAVLVDITALARYGDDLNSIAVRVDADSMEGWWYEGAGLYRHAWLARRAPVSIVTDGVHCDPRKAADGRWTIPVTATIASIDSQSADIAIEATLIDPDGREIAAARAPATIAALGQMEAHATIAAPAPRLWSVEAPTLYTVHTRVLRDGRTVDERLTRIGFRTIRFDADRGFFLNDRAVKLKGVCLHQDHAGVGVAVPDALIDWRLRRLKAMGCNAIRSSHNAPSTELLDACDRIGILVMNENRNFNTSPDYRRQVDWLVRRDRNRPCVILWSVFNEEPMQGTEAGYQMVRRMAAAVRALDDARPVTAAMNGGLFDPVNVSQAVDVVGFNYQIGDFDRFHAANPTLPMTSSEDSSAFMTRGAFTTDRARNILASDDSEFADWGASHRKTWAAIAARPFVAGTFVWTGFDYHGEPTPFGWPSASSFFGIMDLCGFAKTAFDIHRAHWTDDRPVVSIAPHWTWPGREGQAVPVLVMSNAERVALRLNGKAIGDQAVDRIMGNHWQVPYAPGRLEVIAYRGGREVARAAVETSGAPVGLRLTPDRLVMAGDGEDAQPITVDAIDARGRHVPTATLPVTFAVDGGAIIGLGNGDPNDHGAEQGDARALFNGLAQLIVRAAAGRGAVTIRATAPGITAASIRIDRIATMPRLAVPVTRPVLQITDWRRAAPAVSRPDPAIALADNDMNSWIFVQSGTLTAADAAPRWHVYRARFTPRRRVRERGGALVFARIAGAAEIWIDGRKAGEKIDTGPGALRIPIALGAVERTLTVLVRSAAGAASGLGGRVYVTDEQG